MHHHVTSLNSRVVCWRPKQDNHVGGNQSDIFPFASILNTEAGIGTSSLSFLSQEVSQCGVSATALPYNTGDCADSTGHPCILPSALGQKQYRQLNCITKADQYPFPHFQNFHFKLHGK
ncbi:uncharacterized protein LOC143039739 [Oratosquilla oratoria]|uniref:uncharacterized protein LOC143039739 n=1 Tax=Oratosquilla oratoria TaxID=337810 RepID=UPI003F761938